MQSAADVVGLSNKRHGGALGSRVPDHWNFDTSGGLRYLSYSLASCLSKLIS